MVRFLRCLLAGCFLWFPFPASADDFQAVQTVQPPLMKHCPKILLAHFMVTFATPEVSGFRLGWQHRAQVAPADHPQPMIGAYDMTDPDLAEYHCQLLKMAGIDGAVFDLGFFHDPTVSDPRRAQFTLRVISQYARFLKKYGLQCMIVFEEKVHWTWNRKPKTRTQTVAAALHDLDLWLRLLEGLYVRIGGRKPVGVFRYGYDTERGTASLAPQELLRWKQNKKDDPLLLSQVYNADYRGILNGIFEWPAISGLPRGPFTRYNSFEDEVRIWTDQARATLTFLKYRHCELVIGGVWPGFDDRPCRGWGRGSRKIPRFDGRLYDFHWQRVMAADYPVVQIATWNDWFEGTMIEPSDTYGYLYLEKTRAHAGRWKKRALPPADFSLAAKIYKLRKWKRSLASLERAERASRLLAQGRFQAAANLLRQEEAAFMAGK